MIPVLVPFVREGVIVSTANSDTQHHPVFDIRGTQRRLPPEVRSLVDAIMDAVLSWAATQSNSNWDSNSLGGIPPMTTPSLTPCMKKAGYSTAGKRPAEPHLAETGTVSPNFGQRSAAADRRLLRPVPSLRLHQAIHPNYGLLCQQCIRRGRTAARIRGDCSPQ